MAYPDDATARRAKGFFEYWHRRAEFIRTIDTDAHWHEANVLLYAHFDALANLWAKATRRKHGSDRKRFNAFLANCAQMPDVFEKVCAPDLWARAEARDGNIPHNVAVLVERCAGREPGDALAMRMQGLRNVADDPTVQGLLSGDLKAVRNHRWSNARTNAKRQQAITLPAWLSRSLLGEFAYEQLRCSWIHEGRPGQKTHGFSFRDDSGPSYLTNRSAADPKLHFPVPFMATALENALRGFEADVERLGVDPAPPR